MNAPTDKDKALLRQALGQLAAETMPAPGWEQRALPRRPRRMLWLIPAAAAIAAIVMIPNNDNTQPQIAAAGLQPAATRRHVSDVYAPQVQPSAHSTLQTCSHPLAGCKPARAKEPEITVLLPEPEPTEPADYPDMPIGDYIDLMIEEQLLANAEIISTII